MLDAISKGPRARCLTSADVDDEVHRTEINPTEAQIRAGNYRKAVVLLDGLSVAIENPRGSTRRGVNPNGKPWSVVMPDHYGYVHGTEGADGDHIDITIGPDYPSPFVYVIDQMDPMTGKFDEHKTFAGFRNITLAMSSYFGSFSDGSGPSRRGGVKRMTWPEFKSWLRSGQGKKALTMKSDLALLDRISALLTATDHVGTPFKDPIIFSMPTIIKAHTDSSGRRLLEVEASSEDCDQEGDVILQRALLGGMVNFLKAGHIDIDHISEVGARMGVLDPEAWKIGWPIEVKDMGGGRTAVVCEIDRSPDGRVDIRKNRADAVWESINRTPPMKWRASVYGFPIDGMVDDCAAMTCSHGATRYLIKGIDWRSLALTRNPVNDSLTGFARIISAKSYIEIRKGVYPSDDVLGMSQAPFQAPMGTQTSPAPAVPALPKALPTMSDLVGQYHTHMAKCPAGRGLTSTMAFKSHFMVCKGMDEDGAEVCAHALMHHLVMARRRAK